MKTLEHGTVIDLRPLLTRRCSEDTSLSALHVTPSSSQPTAFQGIVLLCERELREKNEFTRFVERFRPAVLLDLRLVSTLTFIEYWGQSAQELFDALRVRYINACDRRGNLDYGDAYWTSEAFKTTLVDAIGEIYSPGTTIACLFGNRAQLRRGRANLLRAVQESTGQEPSRYVARYRSGLLAM